MAKQLSKSGIATGQTIKASEVSQSIDALTGADDYDITISGSLTITGSTSIDGDVFINPTSATTGTSVLTINPTTGKIFRTGSYSSGGSGPTPSLEAVTTAGNTTSNSITTGRITSTGQISASGNLFANVDDSSLVFGAPLFKLVTYDTATGRFYRTGSFSSVLVSSGSKFNVGEDEIVYDDGNGGEGVGIKGTGSKTVEITDKDGNGGKLDLSGGDGNGEVVIGKGGAIQGDTGKGKISPVMDNNIQEDGHFQVLKNNGTKGQISANVRAGTNTTIIDDSIVLSEPTGQIITTGSVTTLSNFVGGGLELIPTAGGNGGNITVTNVGGGNTGLVHINASGSITASGAISASGDIYATTGSFGSLFNHSGQNLTFNGNGDDASFKSFGVVTFESSSVDIRGGNLNVGAGGNVEIDSIVVSLPNLPTIDPGVAGRVWRDGTDLKISVG